ncbi:unnamed protein product [Euphydryas editha]|uniref:Peptidase A2 domain-containing protein n=1 Tax=Euphydryas editha TaxID=104508 RepID=A0AAU9UZU0_EUPED|nr:unnamed protein product [Euphydryas editha]
MESFSSLQEDIRAKIKKARSNVKKAPKDRLTLTYLETRIENLEQLWTSFTSTHKEILKTVKKVELSESDYIKCNIYDEVEELYVDLKSELKEMCLAKNNLTDSNGDKACCQQPANGVSRVKLPEIKIPFFSGKYSEWQTFRDLFIGLVHENKSLDDAQRFFYLKGHLNGEAEQLLRNIKITSDNYIIAWSKLDKMYNNKKFLANGILKRLLNQKALSHESATEIKRLVSTTTECLESIRNLGVDTSSWDLIVIHIIGAKLDNKETRKGWELKVAADSSGELPTFEQFSEFLNSRFRGLENIDQRVDNRNKYSKDVQSFHVVKGKKSLSCVFCSADHGITSCLKFRKENNEARRTYAQENNLCFVCLNNNHSAKYCKFSLKCQVCKRRHHTLLHPTGSSGSISGEGSNTRKETSSTAVQLMKEDNNNDRSVEVAAQAEGSNKPLITCLSTGSGRKTVLLTTAVIKAESKDGSYRLVRALLDQGSQGSFITESTVQYLGLNKTPSKQRVIGVGGDKCMMSKSTVVINVKSRVDPTFQIKVHAFVLKSVTGILIFKLIDFWRRWSHDYLHQFLQRHKWAHRNPEPSVGDVVLVKEDFLPPGKWLLGKVEQKHSGPDGLTRVVTLRTQDAVIKRPTSKLCVLPVTS